MLTLNPGATVERAPGPKYTNELGFVELKPRGPFPRPGTLRKWRETVPDLDCAIVLPKTALGSKRGPLRLNDQGERILTRALEGAASIKASAIVMATDGQLTTGQRDRNLLAEFWDKIRKQAPDVGIVWAAGGLWDAELAFPFAKRNGVTRACDPISDDVMPEGPEAYVRLQAIGERSRFTEGMFLELYENLALAGVTSARVAIESNRSFREATSLKDLCRVIEAQLAMQDDEDYEEDEDFDEEGEVLDDE